LKAGKIVTKRKFGTFLGRYRLAGICCAEKIGLGIHRKANCVRLFKDYAGVGPGSVLRMQLYTLPARQSADKWLHHFDSSIANT